MVGLAVAARRVDPIEAFEQVPAVLVGDRHAGVAHRHPHFVAAPLDADPQRAAGGGVLGGVVQQVGHRPLEQGALDQRAGLAAHLDTDPGLVEDHLEEIHRGGDLAGQRGFLALAGQASLVGAGEEQHVVDDRPQPLQLLQVGLQDLSLCEILGARGVRDSAALAGQDPGYHPQNLAGSFLVLPESTDQVAAVVRLCRQAGRALVPQGGLTGLVGGGAAQAGDVLLSLRRLNRIHRLDAASQTLDLDAGVTLEQAQALAAEAGLDPGIDLAARGSASVGGLVATNAGGIRAFRFGTMRQRVLGLEAVLADGSVYSDLRGLLKNTTGYDLKQLFVGAEGTLGIVTRAVLRLEPLQRPGATALLGLPDVDAAITIAARLRREHAERLFACEILWHDYLQCTAAPMGDSAPSLAPCPLYLLVELAEDRHLDAGEALTALLEDCFEDGLVEDALLAANETQRLAIWRLREDSDAAIHAGVDSLSFDVSLPVPALAGYVERIRRRLDDLVKGMQVFLFGHFLDGNLHVMLAADVPLLPLHQAVEEILYGELGECAGVISAEHGIGLEKKEALGRYADPLKLALMAQIKELLDPSGLFNPGKVIP